MFRCKQFTIEQDQCAMKVNTDSLVLGSWITPNGALSVLDVGTGTGILALMLAQKSSAETKIHAIEIDQNAAIQAKKNVANSKWAGNIHVFHEDLMNFEAKEGYDLIVSNPPYFVPPQGHTNAYHSQSDTRFLARQAASLTPDEFFTFSANNLSIKGSVYCVYPFTSEGYILDIAECHGFRATHILYVKHSAQKLPYLCAFRFQHNGQCNTAANQSSIAIRNKDGEYSKAYRSLCKPFYLHF